MKKKSFRTGFDSLLGDSKIENNELKTEKKQSQKKEKRATFLVEINQYEKIKAISYWERRLIKDILFEALEVYISKYENKKGTIKTPSSD